VNRRYVAESVASALSPVAPTYLRLLGDAGGLEAHHWQWQWQRPAGPPARPPSHACRRLSLVRRQVRPRRRRPEAVGTWPRGCQWWLGWSCSPSMIYRPPRALGNPQRPGCLAPSVKARRLSLRPFGLRPGGPSKPATEPEPQPRTGARLGQPEVPSSLSPPRPPPQHGRPRAAGQGTSHWQVRVRLPYFELRC
jgi:hypothetical protein